MRWNARSAGSAACCLWLAACGAGGNGEEAAAPATADPQEVLERAGMPASAACALVTREDAEELFGGPAERRREPVLTGLLVDRCLWVRDAGPWSRRLELRVRRIPSLSPPPGAEPLDLGVQGYVRADPVSGVEVAWIQGGLLYALTYAAGGPAGAEVFDSVDLVEALARRASGRI